MHNLEFATEELVKMIAIDPGAYMQSNRKAILCLSYDTNMLQVRQMLLEHFGYRVFSSSSVEDAKAVAQRQCPDMLLMDNTHPEIDLEEVATAVKRACPGMIAVVLSPYYYGPRSGTVRAVDRFVVKDDGPDALISQIEQLFGEQERASDGEVLPM
jgi:DNA-binding NtrC family response regulator